MKIAFMTPVNENEIQQIDRIQI